MGSSHFTDITCPWGVGQGQNIGLRDFCHILTLLPPGASVFHKHMSSFECRFYDRPWCKFCTRIIHERNSRQERGKCIFLIYCFYHITCLCNNFYGLSALLGCWSSVFKRRIIYIYLNVCPFDYTAFTISGKAGIT